MDEPPPLEDCSGFLKKLHSNEQLSGACASKTSSKTSTTIPRKEDKTSLVDIGEDKSCVASILSPTNPVVAKPSSKSKPLRRGFFSQPKDKPSVPKEKEVPFIKAKQTGSKVPDFLQVPMEANPQQKVRDEIKEFLKPTQEIVDEVMKNGEIKGEIKASLDDPEIMSAVQDIASNPDHIMNYRNNPKVAAFYNRMGKLMGCAYG